MAGYHPVSNNDEADDTSVRTHQQQNTYLMPAAVVDLPDSSVPPASSYEPLRARSHNVQPYSDNSKSKRRKRGCGCCCWVIVIIIVVFLAVVGAIAGLLVAKPWAHHGSHRLSGNATSSFTSSMPLSSTNSTKSTFPTTSSMTTLTTLSTTSSISTLSTPSITSSLSTMASLTTETSLSTITHTPTKTPTVPTNDSSSTANTSSPIPTNSDPSPASTNSPVVVVITATATATADVTVTTGVITTIWVDPSPPSSTPVAIAIDDRIEITTLSNGDIMEIG